MSDDTNLDNRLAQGRWESVHANDFARMDTPEQRIGFLKELLGNLKKDIGEAKGRPPALTAVDAEALSKGRHCADLAYFKDEESIAQLERECSDPALSESDRKKRTYLVELARRYWAAQDRQREDEQAWQMSHRLEADQRLLITKLDEARLDEAKREEARAPTPPQPVPQEPAEPEDAQDTSETKGSKTKSPRKLDELDGLLDTITKDIQSTEIGRVWDVIKSELRKEKLERRKYDSTGILLQWKPDNYQRTFIWRKADPKARNGYREVPCSKETLSRKRLYLLRKNSHR